MLTRFHIGGKRFAVANGKVRTKRGLGRKPGVPPKTFLYGYHVSFGYKRDGVFIIKNSFEKEKLYSYINLHFYQLGKDNPSVIFDDSSLYTREPLVLSFDKGRYIDTNLPRRNL